MAISIDMESEKNNNEFAPESGLAAPTFEERPKPRWFGAALTISIVFHLALAASVVALRLGPGMTKAQAVSPGVLIAVLRREPRDEVSSAATQPSQPTAALPATPVPQPARPNNAAEQTALSTMPTTPTTAAETASDNVITSVPTTETPAGSNTGTIDAVALQQSIATYMDTYNTQQLTSWIDECQRFRNRYFTQDCTLDPSVRTGNPDIPLSRLLPMIEEDSPLGELARERHALVVAPRDFLENPIIKSRREQLLGPTIRWIAFGPGGVSGVLVDNWITRGVLSELGVVTDPLPVPSFMKPVDEFPDDAVAEQDEGGLTEFERTPSLFPSDD